jgi:hypothetical protein
MPRVRMPSPAALIALVALFVALGGPAQAARLITGKEIKKNTITSKQIKNRSLGVVDLSRGAARRLTATPPSSIGSDKIADGSIAAADLAGASVNSSHVVDQTLQGVDIATNAVSADEIAPNSIQGDELEDGRLGARDVGSFVGTLSLDFPPLAVGACAFVDADVAALAAATPPFTVLDDIVLVTPPASFPDDALALSAAPSAATKVRVRVCNLNGTGAVDLPSLTYRYISFDL